MGTFEVGLSTSMIWSWTYGLQEVGYGGLDEKCLPRGNVFEYLVLSWLHCLGEIMGPLRGGALPENVHHWE